MPGITLMCWPFEVSKLLCSVMGREGAEEDLGRADSILQFQSLLLGIACV